MISLVLFGAAAVIVAAIYASKPVLIAAIHAISNPHLTPRARNQIIGLALAGVVIFVGAGVAASILSTTDPPPPALPARPDARPHRPDVPDIAPGGGGNPAGLPQKE